MLLKSSYQKSVGLVLGFMLLIFLMCGSLVFGYTDTSLKTVYEAFTNFNGTNEHIIVYDVRLPRALIGAVVGASLALAGAIMQALTKNPLASPSVFGINAGAGFFIVVAVSVFYVNSYQAYIWIAFAGAAFSAFIVYFIGSFGREGLTPMKLTLAGAAMAALFSSLTQGLLVVNEAALDQVLFWLAGSIQGRKLEGLYMVLPYVLPAIILSMILSQKINVLTMGEDVAKGLGQRTGVVKLIGALLVIVLGGGAVAVAGPIAFIGIVIPHFARFLVGNDYRWILPFSTFLGGSLLVFADILARYIVMPEEVPVGVMTAFIGTPFFIYIARRGFGK
ncbi:MULTISPECIES: FecCD family ABC transporter permease [Metabacillus]|uniref:FecCD family ABC transporter permease n=1 Tax=Metabacillus TaxID=2675233 RepID=UPI000EF57693|nr:MULTISPECIES: iron ABC transporter permease [Metabacillus]MCM3161226.1 iron ABC transporter permease [Metabacillus litoralis]MCM3412100.1 iron ABC transporter permease [Metabacillus litoralis]UGB30162.1 iron ABC transporter permease [Metabacillus sp. B2-18]UHA61894.1 iron ABC transporter permease [Metabacillus litoralis]